LASSVEWSCRDEKHASQKRATLAVDRVQHFAQLLSTELAKFIFTMGGAEKAKTELAKLKF